MPDTSSFTGDHLSVRPIGILLVDDHELIRDGLRALLAQGSEFSVVGEAGNGAEAVEQAKRLKPQVVIMDISMPVMDGIEATRAIRACRELKEIRVIALSMYANRGFVNELMNAGANGYLLKNTGLAELSEAIRAVCAGERFLSQAVRDIVEAEPKRGARGMEDTGSSRPPITKREKEVIRLILADKNNNEIAEVLHLSPQTIETHRKNILYKLGLHSSTGLVRYAMERGWFTSGAPKAPQ